MFEFCRIRSYMLPHRLRRLDELLVGGIYICYLLCIKGIVLFQDRGVAVHMLFVHLETNSLSNAQQHLFRIYEYSKNEFVFYFSNAGLVGIEMLVRLQKVLQDCLKSLLMRIIASTSAHSTLPVPVAPLLRNVEF